MSHGLATDASFDAQMREIENDIRAHQNDHVPNNDVVTGFPVAYPTYPDAGAGAGAASTTFEVMPGEPVSYTEVSYTDTQGDLVRFALGENSRLEKYVNGDFRKVVTKLKVLSGFEVRDQDGWGGTVGPNARTGRHVMKKLSAIARVAEVEIEGANEHHHEWDFAESDDDSVVGGTLFAAEQQEEDRDSDLARAREDGERKKRRRKSCVGLFVILLICCFVAASSYAAKALAAARTAACCLPATCDPSKLSAEEVQGLNVWCTPTAEQATRMGGSNCSTDAAMMRHTDFASCKTNNDGACAEHTATGMAIGGIVCGFLIALFMFLGPLMFICFGGSDGSSECCAMSGMIFGFLVFPLVIIGLTLSAVVIGQAGGSQDALTWQLAEYCDSNGGDDGCTYRDIRFQASCGTAFDGRQPYQLTVTTPSLVPSQAPLVGLSALMTLFAILAFASVFCKTSVFDWF